MGRGVENSQLMGGWAAQGAGMSREAFEQSQISTPSALPCKLSMSDEQHKWRESTALVFFSFHVLTELQLINTAVCGSLISCCSLCLKQTAREIQNQQVRVLNVLIVLF